MTAKPTLPGARRDLLKKASADGPTLQAANDLGDAAQKVVKAVG